MGPRKPVIPPRIVDRCIFCGDSPTHKEHIFSKWMRRHLSRTRKHWSTKVFSNETGEDFHGWVQYNGDPLDHSVKCVCQPRCNGGWMSDFEGKVKPVLIPLMMGDEARFAPSDLTTLASWIAIKCIVLEHDTGSFQVSTQRQIKSFMIRKRPPTNWKIWIGHCPKTDRQHLLSNFGFALYMAGDSYTNRINTQSFTYICGEALIHIVRMPRKFGVQRWNFPVLIDSKLRQIWPTRIGAGEFSVRWPPTALTADEVKFVTTAFHTWVNGIAEMRRRPGT